MKLYQPFLFVGLGGTGCAVGAELERQVREEICGPDGSLFQRLRPDAQRYQLPACLQFVYADVNQADLNRMATSVVPGAQHASVVSANAHYVRDLVPQVSSYPQVALNLRLALEAADRAWLPPEHGEPQVMPLSRGAGQLPTVGRAALFETFRSGVAPAVRDLDRAIGNLSGQQAARDLRRLAGTSSMINRRAVDVFVAFSVAGGTGAGIFYDYLHLISRQFQGTDLQLKIFPLVLMPSAFDEGKGGGRAAELNAGRALLDLFQLIDYQNAPRAVQHLSGLYAEQTDPEEVAVRYPQEGRIAMRHGLAQTAFLFSRPAGVSAGDLRRSVVSLVMSLVGTELGEQRRGEGEQHQSFADSFINSATTRQTMAANGVGNRGVSTALVTSLTTPVDELADVVAGRLLRLAVEGLREPDTANESNAKLIEDFFTTAGIHPIFARPRPQFTEPEPATGARDIASALTDRVQFMRQGLGEQRARLEGEVPAMVTRFDPGGAAAGMLAQYDPFRVRRVMFGHAALSEGPDKVGAAGVMQRRRQPPTGPDGGRDAPPAIPQLRDRSLGVVRMKWNDDIPTGVRQQQDKWFRYRNQVQWADAWSAQAQHWERTLKVVEENLRALGEALTDTARQEPDRFRERADHLYRPRDGVAYHLPSTTLEQFCRNAIARIRERLQLPPGVQDAVVLERLLGEDGWRPLYRQASETTPVRAVDELRDRIKIAVKTYLQEEAPGLTTLLPRLRDLLDQAVGLTSSRPKFGETELEEFNGRLAGLMPANFTPQGAGPLKVLVTYPGGVNQGIADYLKDTLRLPADPGITYEFSNTTAESISVVLFRSQMGITDVQEVREVLRTWADAIHRPRSDDFLAWRQRTGYDFGYLATREEHRTRILHRLLVAMWNGDVQVMGDRQSPARVQITLNDVHMALDLKAMEEASSWASLLQAYELWALADDNETARVFCGKLMQLIPNRLDEGGSPPGKLFELVVGMADSQIRAIDTMLTGIGQAGRARARLMRKFWAETLPGALEQHFDSAAPRENLEQLYQSYLRRRGDVA
ncbi:hypothetical protein FDA94_26590 [Herbidospora galbida]|uniref:Tubulin-like protein n=1 Tax=Herbidospora galbida TaxID=2575442 RepID=A0A4U3M9I2_9ACTN|nr:tubulin-like doman-containing protein [Herbidospora galbida]TKK85240.1 hypothetical protein FDA94_26590 [Herbidospora galbida]